MDNRKYGFLLVILIPVSIGLLIYGLFIYKGNSSNVKDDVNIEFNEDLSQTYLKPDSRQVKSLMSFMVVDNENIYKTNGNIYDDYFYKNNYIDADNIQIKDKLMIALNSLVYNKKMDYKNVDIEALKEEYYKIFGKDSEFDTVDFSGSCAQYSYNSKKGTYEIEQDGNCGNSIGGSISKIYQAIMNVSSSGNYIDVYEYYAYEEYSNSGSYISYYADYSKGNLILKNSSEVHDISYFVDNYSDKLGVYKYHFEMEDDNYIFKNVEKVK